jgi:hypothetical protein
MLVLCILNLTLPNGFMKSMGRVLDLSGSTVKLTLSNSNECVEEGKAAPATF